MERTENLLKDLQNSDNIIIGNKYNIIRKLQDLVILIYLGVLSALLLQLMIKAKGQVNSQFQEMKLSPSFYQPECLRLYFEITNASPDQKALLAQLNSFQAWMELEMDESCVDYMKIVQNKRLVIQYCLYKIDK